MLKFFKFDLNNKFLERIDVETVIMENEKLWKLEDGFRLKINENPESFKQTSLENLDANKIEKNFRPPETISFEFK